MKANIWEYKNFIVVKKVVDLIKEYFYEDNQTIMLGGKGLWFVNYASTQSLTNKISHSLSKTFRTFYFILIGFYQP